MGNRVKHKKKVTKIYLKKKFNAAKILGAGSDEKQEFFFGMAKKRIQWQPVEDVEVFLVVGFRVLIHDFVQQFHQIVGEVSVKVGDGGLKVLICQYLEKKRNKKKQERETRYGHCRNKKKQI